jgi:hypothetical protein
VPELDKILQMARLFGVSTDYLLKDEIEKEEHVDDGEEPKGKKVSLAFAHEYLTWRENAAKRIALGVALCILAAIPLIFLGGVSEVYSALSENTAGGVGLILLLVVVAAAVAIMIQCGFLNAPYEFLDKEPFELEYGVMGMVKEKQKQYRPIYAKTNIIGVVLCILSPLPIALGALMSLDDLMLVCFVCLLLAMIAAAVYLFVRVGTVWGAMQRLLQEGDFDKKSKEKSSLQETVGGVYWCAVTAGYLLWSFLSSDWHMTWVVWPVAAVLFGAVEAVLTYVEDRKK